MKQLRTLLVFLLLLALPGAAPLAGARASGELRAFDIPPGPAERTLRVFAEQSGWQVGFPSVLTNGVTTRAVQGQLTPEDAAVQLLAGTRLRLVKDEQSGAYAVVAGGIAPGEPSRGAGRPPTSAAGGVPPRAETTAVRSPVAAEAVAPGGAAGDAVVLSPFEVVTDRDVGFVPAVSLAGGRMSTSLRDTPLAYSVLTQEFIEALNLVDTEKAMEWAVNSYEVRGDGTDRIANLDGGSRTTSRGVKPKVLRNFFELGRFGDTYNQDRIDYARGSNALLIGNGTLGGALIMLTKQAQTGRYFGSASLSLQSFSQRRVTLDVNQPIGDTLAVRFNALWQDAGSWRDRIFDRRQGFYVTSTFRPLPRTKLRVDYETFVQRELVAVSYLADRVSGWDGRTVFAAPTPALANSNALGVERVGSDTSEYRLMLPGMSEGVVMNWANTWRTMGGGQTATTPINGVLPLSTANVGAAGSYMFGVVNEPRGRYTLATANSRFTVPGPEAMIGPDFPTFIQFLDNVSAYVDQQVGENVFLQGSFSSSKTGRRTETMVSALAQIYVDLNRTLPDGRPNPRFLEPYGESSSTAQSNGVDRFDEYRVAAAWLKERTRLGSFKFNALAGHTTRATDNRNKIRVLARNPSLRERVYADTFGRRYYLTEGWRPFSVPTEVTYVDPVARTSRTYPVQELLNLAAGNVSAKRTFDYVQAAGFAQLFRDRVALLAGARRDRFRFTTRNQISNPRTSVPADWDGRTFVEAPAAPADYWDLSPAARAPYSPPEIDQAVNTISYGAVVHLGRGASAFYNFAQTYDTSRAVQELSGALVAPVQSEGWDAGLRFSLAGDRVNVSLATYGSQQVRNISQGPGFLQTLVEANVAGDLSETGRNRRGLGQLPASYFDYVDRLADGYEVEVVGNVTRGWRLTANLGLPTVKQYNYFTDTWAYVRAHEATLRQIALDAGATISANNVAATSLPAGEARDAAAAVAAWNSLQAWKLSNDPDRRVTNATYKFTANLYTDYRFSEGRLRGLRLGAGVQYRSRIEIGNRAGDTIVNPANPLTAVDDPSVDVNTLVYMDPWYLVTATAGYQWRLGGGRTVSFDLRVSNLLNLRDPIYNGVSLRPPGGDIRSPARVSGGGTHYYLDPRTVAFSTRVSF